MSVAVENRQCQPVRRAGPAPTFGPVWSRIARGVTFATVVHVFVAAGLLVLLCGVSEDWWVSAALSYLPRAPYLAFSLAIVPALLLRRWGAAATNGLCGLVIAGPVMGLCAPVGNSDGAVSRTTAESRRVLTCNIQNGDSDLPTLLAEIDALAPDVVALQETQRSGDALSAHFAEWHTVHVGEFFVASRAPLRLIDQHVAEATRRPTAVLCEVDGPDGTWLLCNVHLSTARHGLTKLRWHSPLSGEGVDDLRWRQWERRLESEETLKFVSRYEARPVIVLGDFNTPTGSSLFSDVWAGWRSAFDTAGWGYGFTSPCNTSRLWPANTPWLRIDHILCDSGWVIDEVGIGQSAGSDHRLMWSRVSPAAGMQD